MNIEDYFEEVKGITVDAARNCRAKYTAIDICKFAKNYHERQVEILNLQRVSVNEMAVCDDEIHNTYRNYDFHAYCPECGKEL